ncbi:hypothetical protein J8L70_13715 [Pseudoalteromonas sp. MMG010]|uniref:hypothetical protein n=1 Tax=Pseudoalteromonas sp. MMG010 TaxID=2822685 RepID=UPI001B3A13E2|nr:hypothetical protein [Pseudoalteromonas sp. MMG010]MBQ4834305.1 hypothetical protein [Pseudoalteromonas sp. MMG010]
MKKLIMTTSYQGLPLACYWNSITKNILLISQRHELTVFTCFGFFKAKKTLKITPKIAIEMHFRKLSKEKIGIIMLKIKGVLLKAQAIDISSGDKVALASLNYQQLVAR